MCINCTENMVTGRERLLCSSSQAWIIDLGSIPLSSTSAVSVLWTTRTRLCPKNGSCLKIRCIWGFGCCQKTSISHWACVAWQLHSFVLLQPILYEWSYFDNPFSQDTFPLVYSEAWLVLYLTSMGGRDSARSSVSSAFSTVSARSLPTSTFFWLVGFSVESPHLVCTQCLNHGKIF